MALTAAEIWRDYVTASVPASGPHSPNKREIRPYLATLESLLNGSAAGLVYTTRTSLFADLEHDAHVTAVVYADVTAAYNGLYLKSGDSGEGSWTRIGDLPTSIVTITPTGGTGNAIIATAPESPTTPGAKLYLFTPTAQNTDATTINVNGTGAVAIKNAFGMNLAAGSLLVGSQVLMAYSVDHYQLLISANVDADAILADAQDAAATAVQAAADAVTAGGVVTDYLPGIMAWKEGVPGDGTDQTAALQALIDAADSGGETIWLRGNVVASAIDLHGRNHIVFKGIKGGGGGQGAKITITAGAIGAGVAAIDCHATTNVSFHEVNIVASNALFNGVLLDYGGSAPLVNGSSSYMQVENCFMYSPSASAVLLRLYGTTNGSFRDVKFQGPGRAIALQGVASVGFCNNHLFESCVFQPGALYPIAGSGEGITFQSCCFQAGTDGQGRAVITTTNQQFKGLSFDGCTFYDPLSTGDEWIIAPWGSGFGIVGGRMSIHTGNYGVSLAGTADADPDEGGVRGVSITGAHFDGGSGAIFFNGTASAKSNVRGGIIAGNRNLIGILLGNYSEAQNVVLLGNSIYGADALGVGVLPQILGLPTYANNAAAVSAGLQVGQIYRVGNVLQIV